MSWVFDLVVGINHHFLDRAPINHEMYLVASAFLHIGKTITEVAEYSKRPLGGQVAQKGRSFLDFARDPEPGRGARRRTHPCRWVPGVRGTGQMDVSGTAGLVRHWGPDVCAKSLRQNANDPITVWGWPGSYALRRSIRIEHSCPTP